MYVCNVYVSSIYTCVLESLYIHIYFDLLSFPVFDKHTHSAFISKNKWLLIHSRYWFSMLITQQPVSFKLKTFWRRYRENTAYYAIHQSRSHSLIHLLVCVDTECKFQSPFLIDLTFAIAFTLILAMCIVRIDWISYCCYWRSFNEINNITFKSPACADNQPRLRWDIIVSNKCFYLLTLNSFFSLSWQVKMKIG